MLFALIILPIIAAIVISSAVMTERTANRIALFTVTTVWILVASTWTYITLKSGTIWGLFVYSDYNGYYLVQSITSIGRLGELSLGLDGISLVFVTLTAYVMPFAILSTWENVAHAQRSHLVILLILESILLLVFMSLDLIIFFISFETVLIPLFILIVLHGSTEGRLRAALLLFMYTLIGSFCMLLSIMQLYNLTGSTDMIALGAVSKMLSPESQRWIWAGIFASIAIKSPLFPLHGWLYHGHSEASLSGSIILAGIILKLATYAYLRILIPMLPEACEYYRPIVLTIACCSLIHGSLATLRQTDSKRFVAYSSVGHLAIVILALAAGTVNGLTGAIMLSVAHGLISPALFIVVGGVIYDRYHSRTIRLFRGLGSFMPSLKVWFFLASCASMAVPGTYNWVAELFCLTGAFEAAPVAGIIASSSVILGAIYTIWLYNQLIGGQVSPQLSLLGDITFRERSMLVWLIVPAIALGICPTILNQVLITPIAELSTISS